MKKRLIFAVVSAVVMLCAFCVFIAVIAQSPAHKATATAQAIARVTEAVMLSYTPTQTPTQTNTPAPTSTPTPTNTLAPKTATAQAIAAKNTTATAQVAQARQGTATAQTATAQAKATSAMVYAHEARIRLDKYKQDLNDFITHHNDMSNDSSLLTDKDWRKKMGWLLDDLGASSQSLTGIPGAPGESVEVSQWFTKIKQETGLLVTDYVSGADNLSTAAIAQAIRHAENVKAHVQQADFALEKWTRSTVLGRSVTTWAGVYIGMPGDDVLKIHPKPEAEQIGTDSEGLIAKWTYPDAYLIFALREGKGTDSLGMSKCYRVIEIYLR